MLFPPCHYPLERGVPLPYALVEKNMTPVPPGVRKKLPTIKSSRLDPAELMNPKLQLRNLRFGNVCQMAFVLRGARKHFDDACGVLFARGWSD